MLKRVIRGVLVGLLVVVAQICLSAIFGDNTYAWHAYGWALGFAVAMASDRRKGPPEGIRPESAK